MINLLKLKKTKLSKLKILMKYNSVSGGNIANTHSDKPQTLRTLLKITHDVKSAVVLYLLFYITYINISTYLFRFYLFLRHFS